ncbi:hypothetical protein C7B61_05280 [filamentous cyanobacterium CCP1]|nr:hypothetical protein C7B76_21540 [filamentous cyanobacterium CCP2]PSB67605.1 hypothetical protein C7B61_05280 [filamentous cyanobacterium CCP1]
MSRTMNQTNAERIESLKAGIFGLITAGFVFGITEIAGRFILLQLGFNAPIDRLFPLLPLQWSSLLPGTAVLVSGFLFGVTYRYIVRQDDNPQLKAGAVMAFGLVRGFAQISEMAQLDGLLSGGRVLESVLLFGGAGLVLDWAMERGWIKAFDA